MADVPELPDAAEPATVAAVRTGYTVAGPAVELGALVVAGTGYPDVGVRVPLATLNRHGLVAGATGTGKTKTLQLMAEQLSTHGVPVFAADIKGDLSGLAQPGEASERVAQRAAETGQTWTATGFPVELLTLGATGAGLPVRATVTSFGPTLLAKVLDLGDVQESSLGLVFHYADKAGLPLLDLADLRAVVQHLTSDEGRAELKQLGGLSRQTAGVILRELIAFEDQGAAEFFGEPEASVVDLLRTAPDGRGVITLLELPGVQDRPALFSTFLMWLLAELFEELPEVGDLDEPKLVFFFDEAHLLFSDASEDFLDAVARTVRLIRSKGVGVFFVTQVPGDVPDAVLAQLGNRVQHALRAFTPDDADALRRTVRTYPVSDYDLEEVLTTMGTGEAVVTVLSERGAPTPVAWTRMRAPESRMAPADQGVLDAAVAASLLAPRYGQVVDRESAYEMLAAKLATDAAPPPAPAPVPEPPDPVPSPEPPAPPPPAQEATVLEQVLGSDAMRSAMRSAGTVLGREIVRGIFGTRRRRR